ncbi:MAG: hypothetical protein STSR0008_03850 [Ignavibacterium sp.]
MRKSFFNIIFLGILLSLSISSVYAQPMKRQNIRQNIYSKLNLTDEQQDKIDQLRINHQKKMVDLRADLEKSQLELKDLMTKGNYSRTDYLKVVQNIQKKREVMSTERANHQMDVYEILSPEQKEIWNDSRGNFDGFGMNNKRFPNCRRM